MAVSVLSPLCNCVSSYSAVVWVDSWCGSNICIAPHYQQQQQQQCLVSFSLTLIISITEQTGQTQG